MVRKKLWGLLVVISANKSLDMTIEYLGWERFDASLPEYQSQRKATSAQHILYSPDLQKATTSPSSPVTVANARLGVVDILVSMS